MLLTTGLSTSRTMTAAGQSSSSEGLGAWWCTERQGG
jgi:hypothetical protein